MFFFCTNLICRWSSRGQRSSPKVRRITSTVWHAALKLAWNRLLQSSSWLLRPLDELKQNAATIYTTYFLWVKWLWWFTPCQRINPCKFNLIQLLDVRFSFWEYLLPMLLVCCLQDQEYLVQQWAEGLLDASLAAAQRWSSWLPIRRLSDRRETATQEAGMQAAAAARELAEKKAMACRGEAEALKTAQLEAHMITLCMWCLFFYQVINVLVQFCLYLYIFFCFYSCVWLLICW